MLKRLVEKAESAVNLHDEACELEISRRSDCVSGIRCGAEVQHIPRSICYIVSPYRQCSQICFRRQNSSYCLFVSRLRDSYNCECWLWLTARLPDGCAGMSVAVVLRLTSGVSVADLDSSNREARSQATHKLPPRVVSPDVLMHLAAARDGQIS